MFEVKVQNASLNHEIAALAAGMRSVGSSGTY